MERKATHTVCGPSSIVSRGPDARSPNHPTLIMLIVESLESRALPLAGAAVTIGKFFAVHLGHQALIRETVAAAGRRRAASAVLTFDRHPLEVLKPGSTFPILTSLDERLELFRALGVDATVIVPLDTQFL